MPPASVDNLPFLVLQHVDCEPPAAFGDELAARGLCTATVEFDRRGKLPTDPTEFAGVIAMGGPMGVYDTAQHDWIVAELNLLEATLTANLPIWGVCLGAQLLAAALGARVAPGPAPEVGVRSVRLTAEAAADPVFSLAPNHFEALHWHGDTYELPQGAVRLAESDAYPQQAFRFGRSLGLQFHLEVSPSLARRWAKLPTYAAGLEQALGPDALPRLVGRVDEVAPDAISLGRRLFAAWLEEALA